MWLFVLILTTFSASAEIFTLSTENNVTCVVTESDAKAAVYINPPIKSGKISRDIFLTLNIAHTYSLCSVLKNTGQCMYVIT
jgi:predicted transcriptional regulator